MPMYREDLEQPPQPCAVPGCGDIHPDDDLWFHAKCHLDSPTWARYRAGVLTIQYARCEKDVVALHIARRPAGRRARTPPSG